MMRSNRSSYGGSSMRLVGALALGASAAWSPLSFVACDAANRPVSGAGTDASPDDASHVVATDASLADGDAGDALGNDASLDAQDSPNVDAATPEVNFTYNGGFDSIHGTSASDVWAVGGDQIVHFNGSTWAPSVGTAALTDSGLNSFTFVWAATPSDAWVSASECSVPGDCGAMHLRHWDGATWTNSDDAVFSGQGAAIWGSSASDVWAADNNHLNHWNGQSWTTDSIYSVEAIAGSSASDIWGVGVPEDGRATGTIHWDGTTWSEVSTPIPDPFEVLEAVWTGSASNAWAVGDDGTILHWDGATWQPTPSGTTLNLFTVWGAGPSDVWAGGANAFVHWDGTAWSTVSLPFAGPDFIIRHVWGASASNVWAATSEGIAHWNGQHWTLPPPPCTSLCEAGAD